MSNQTRRDLLRGIAGAAAGVLLPRDLWALEQGDSLPKPKGIPYKKPGSPVTAIILGYGGRGGYYGSMQAGMQDDWKIVGVAEPIDYRRERAASVHSLSADRQWTTWEHVFDKPKMADVIVISTPDNLHHKPAMRALEMGYNLLLEKPIAQTWRQCNDILVLAEKKQATVAVCHVLRYAPYFVQLQEVIRSGMIGDVVSIQHMEPIHYLHFAHSYVRGPWHNLKDSNPSLLAKSCHDLDLIRWFAGKNCKRVASFGSLKHFAKEYAPKGAPTHCSMGCPVESTCIYNAQDMYVREKRWGTHHIITRDRSDDAILAAMKGTQYDACVYRHRNDVVDHQVVMMEFESKITASFNMEAMTSYGGRRTRIMGTKGDIVGDERYLDVYDFEKQKAYRWDVNQQGGDLGGHGGGDVQMVRDFTQAIIQDNQALLATNLRTSMESHLMGFRAEESRNKGGSSMVVQIGK
ncbi:MAG TPA: Gfo/Idh/MocA family oxidoreductase [Fimbriimonadaceae bacterium]|nr:Gfo/Idh/MocA family oxidoreductase [Fimbriimonadaceae bacterium]